MCVVVIRAYDCTSRMILEASAQSRWNLVVLYRPTRADSVPPPSRRSATGSAVATAAASTTCDARPARFPANMGNGMNKVSVLRVHVIITPNFCYFQSILRQLLVTMMNIKHKYHFKYIIIKIYA